MVFANVKQSDADLFDEFEDDRDIFRRVIEEGDPLAHYLIRNRYVSSDKQNLEEWLYLNYEHIRVIPRGGKIKERDRIEILISSGKEIMDLITESIENDDELGLMENIEDISDTTRRLLMDALPADQRNKLNLMCGKGA